MKKLSKKSISLLILLLLVGSSACSGWDNLFGDEETTTLKVINNSSYEIYAIYCAPSNNTTWGKDLLGNSTLFPGEIKYFKGFPYGSYDIRVDTEETYQDPIGALVQLNHQFVDSEYLFEIIDNIP